MFYEVTALASIDDQQLLMATSTPLGRSFFSSLELHNIHLFDPFLGDFVWSSVPLVGQINGMDVLTDPVTGVQKIAISTDAAMYIAK